MICGYTTKQKGNLKQHKTNKHNIGIIWWYCDLCDHQCKQSSALKTYKNSNVHFQDVKWYQCEFYDYRAVNKSALKTINKGFII